MLNESIHNLIIITVIKSNGGWRSHVTQRVGHGPQDAADQKWHERRTSMFLPFEALCIVLGCKQILIFLLLNWFENGNALLECCLFTSPLHMSLDLLSDDLWRIPQEEGTACPISIQGLYSVYMRWECGEHWGVGGHGLSGNYTKEFIGSVYWRTAYWSHC